VNNVEKHDSNETSLATLLEALLFASEGPISQEDLTTFSGKKSKEVKTGLKTLETRLREHSGLVLVQVAGGYRLETKPEYYELIREMFIDKRASKLSMAALETLALVAYKQPITSIEIAELRMVTSVNSIIRNLLEKKLIKPAGRKKVIGRPMMYATTKAFLIHFGLNQLSDLPALEDFQEKLAQNEEIEGQDIPTTENASFKEEQS
jgi:segregation and condensation protein B